MPDKGIWCGKKYKNESFIDGRIHESKKLYN